MQELDMLYELRDAGYILKILSGEEGAWFLVIKSYEKGMICDDVHEDQSLESLIGKVYNDYYIQQKNHK